MDVNIYSEIQSITSYLKLSITSQEVAQFCSDESLNDEQIQAIADFLNYMKDLRHTHLVEMLKTMSRIPSREPKTFENFDFTRIHGKNVEALKNLSFLLKIKSSGFNIHKKGYSVMDSCRKYKYYVPSYKLSCKCFFYTCYIASSNNNMLIIAKHCFYVTILRYHHTSKLILIYNTVLSYSDKSKAQISSPPMLTAITSI